MSILFENIVTENGCRLSVAREQWRIKRKKARKGKVHISKQNYIGFPNLGVSCTGDFHSTTV